MRLRCALGISSMLVASVEVHAEDASAAAPVRYVVFSSASDASLGGEVLAKAQLEALETADECFGRSGELLDSKGWVVLAAAQTMDVSGVVIAARVTYPA